MPVRQQITRQGSIVYTYECNFCPPYISEPTSWIFRDLQASVYTLHARWNIFLVKNVYVWILRMRMVKGHETSERMCLTG